MSPDSDKILPAGSRRTAKERPPSAEAESLVTSLRARGGLSGGQRIEDGEQEPRRITGRQIVGLVLLGVAGVGFLARSRTEAPASFSSPSPRLVAASREASPTPRASRSPEPVRSTVAPAGVADVPPLRTLGLLVWIVQEVDPALRPELRLAGGRAGAHLPVARGPGVLYGAPSTTPDPVALLEAATGVPRSRLLALAQDANQAGADRCAVRFLSRVDGSEQPAPLDSAAEALGPAWELDLPLLEKSRSAGLPSWISLLEAPGAPPEAVITRAILDLVIHEDTDARARLGSLDAASSPALRYLAAGYLRRMGCPAEEAAILTTLAGPGAGAAAAHFRLGEILARRGQKEAALSHFLESYHLSEDELDLRAHATVARARTTEDEKELEAADEHLGRLSPRERIATGLDASLAALAIRRSDVSRAITYLEACLALGGPAEKPVVDLLYCYRTAGDTIRASRLLDLILPMDLGFSPEVIEALEKTQEGFRQAENVESPSKEKGF